MVVTSDDRATQAAVGILEKGGNAADALVAAQTVLNVTEPHASGIGGAGYLLFYDAGTRRVLYFDGSAKAPGKAHSNMFRDPNGALMPYPERRACGLATGVPGTLKLLREVQLKYGSVKFPFGKLLEPAIALAEKGSPVSEELASAIAANSEELARSNYSGKIFLKNGTALRSGDILVQPDLAKTFRSLAAQKKSDDDFYRGSLGKTVARSFRPSAREALTQKDLSRYDLTRQAPLHGLYHGYDLFVPPPPSAGGLMLLASCNILQEFDLSAFAGQPESIHWVEEVQKLTGPLPGMVGDPELFNLPVSFILSPDWSKKQAEQLDANKAYRPSGEQKTQKTGTGPRASASVLIIDKSGSVAAYTGTLGSPFGSKVTVPGAGFFLNDLLNDFETDPAVLRDPDATNIPEAYARPRNDAVMTIVFKEGRPVLVLNTLDGKRSAAVALNMLVQWADFQIPCEVVAKTPRVLDRDGVMEMEKALYDKQDTARVKLELIGHKIEAQDRLGNAQTICYERDSGKLSGQSDPRDGGSAAGF